MWRRHAASSRSKLWGQLSFANSRRLPGETGPFGGWQSPGSLWSLLLERPGKTHITTPQMQVKDLQKVGLQHMHYKKLIMLAFWQVLILNAHFYWDCSLGCCSVNNVATYLLCFLTFCSAVTDAIRQGLSGLFCSSLSCFISPCHFNHKMYDCHTTNPSWHKLLIGF